MCFTLFAKFTLKTKGYLRYQCLSVSELQIRGGIEDNSKIIFSLFNENICCDPSLEPSH